MAPGDPSLLDLQSEIEAEANFIRAKKLWSTAESDFATGRFDSAAKTAAEAFALAPNRSEYATKAVEWYNHAGQHERAAEVANEAARQHPKSIELRIAQVEALFRCGEKVAARECLEKARALDADHEGVTTWDNKLSKKKK